MLFGTSINGLQYLFYRTVSESFVFSCFDYRECSHFLMEFLVTCHAQLKSATMLLIKTIKKRRFVLQCVSLLFDLSRSLLIAVILLRYCYLGPQLDPLSHWLLSWRRGDLVNWHIWGICRLLLLIIRVTTYGRSVPITSLLQTFWLNLNWCRIYEGVIKKGDFIHNVNTGKKIKVSTSLFSICSNYFVSLQLFLWSLSTFLLSKMFFMGPSGWFLFQLTQTLLGQGPR